MNVSRARGQRGQIAGADEAHRHVERDVECGESARHQKEVLLHQAEGLIEHAAEAQPLNLIAHGPPCQWLGAGRATQPRQYRGGPLPVSTVLMRGAYKCKRRRTPCAQSMTFTSTNLLLSRSVVSGSTLRLPSRDLKRLSRPCSSRKKAGVPLFSSIHSLTALLLRSTNTATRLPDRGSPLPVHLPGDERLLRALALLVVALDQVALTPVRRQIDHVDVEREQRERASQPDERACHDRAQRAQGGRGHEQAGDDREAREDRPVVELVRKRAVVVVDEELDQPLVAGRTLARWSTRGRGRRTRTARAPAISPRRSRRRPGAVLGGPVAAGRARLAIELQRGDQADAADADQREADREGPRDAAAPRSLAARPRGRRASTPRTSPRSPATPSTSGTGASSASANAPSALRAAAAPRPVRRPSMRSSSTPISIAAGGDRREDVVVELRDHRAVQRERRREPQAEHDRGLALARVEAACPDRTPTRGSAESEPAAERERRERDPREHPVAELLDEVLDAAGIAVHARVRRLR